MLIQTTVYFTELKDLEPEPTAEQSVPLQPSPAKSHQLFRELLSLYEGRNRLFPCDRSR